MKKLKIRVILMLFCVASYAQQERQFTHYMYNTTVINPSYAGISEKMSAVFLNRSQWSGLEGAPKTQFFSFHTPFIDSRFGVGLSIVNEEIGPVSEQDINIDVSYNISINDNSNIAVGLKLLGQFLNVDLTGRLTGSSSDILQRNVNDFNPNIGLGVSYYGDQYHVGFAVPAFVNSDHGDNAGEERRAFYLNGEYRFQVRNNLELRPSSLFKFVSGAPLQFDLSVNALIHQKFLTGLSYSLNNSVSGMLGFKVRPQWLIGYSYDWSTNDLADYNSGSHEILLRFQLPKLNSNRKSRYQINLERRRRASQKYRAQRKRRKY